MNYEQYKKKIKNNFERTTAIYDKYATVQTDIFNKMLNELKQTIIPQGVYADYGCGTCTNTQQLTDIISPIHAIDLIKNPLKNLTDDIIYQQTDFDKTLFQNNSVALLFSNMALHWSSDFSYLINIIYQSLCDNGLLYFSIPIDGMFKEINHLHRNDFIKLPELLSQLTTMGFYDIKHSVFEYVLHYESAHAALSAIKNTGANTVIKNKKQGLNKNITAFNNVDNISLTYKIVLISARKHHE